MHFPTATRLVCVLALLGCDSGDPSMPVGDAGSDGGIRADARADARPDGSDPVALPDIDPIDIVVTTNGARTFRLTDAATFAALEVQLQEPSERGTLAFYESGLINYAPAATHPAPIRSSYASPTARKARRSLRQ